MSMFDGLQTDTDIVKNLSVKYQVPQTVIAYLRAALMRSDSKYDQESLKNHIIEENQNRRADIQTLKNSITEENIEQKKEEITAIQRRIDFRQGALAVLRTIEEKQLRDILQPEI